MLAVSNALVRWRLTLRKLRASLYFELLRRFGVSGRKRSYQTLSVAARSFAPPFSFPGRVSLLCIPSPAAATPLAMVFPESPPARPSSSSQAQNEVGAACCQAAPLDRHSEVLLCMASPGSGWAAKVNFSNNSNSILNIAQSHQRSYTMEYSDNFSWAGFFRISVLRGRTLPEVTVLPTRFP
jgi:hypothetical protein